MLPAIATVPVEADAVRHVSEHVQVTIAGAPDGTEVFGPSGLLAVLPAKVQLPRSQESVLLSFRALGFASKSVLVAADSDKLLEVELEANFQRPAHINGRKERKKGRASGKDGRNAIEDPF